MENPTLDADVISFAEDKMKIGVLLGSTRQRRKGAAVADWVMRAAAGRSAEYELIDLADHALPHFDEPMPPMTGKYTDGRTRAWSAVIESFDAFVIVTPEYNHGIPGVLKNALDHLFVEWSGKAVGFVGYGSVGGARALDQLRVLAGVLGMADVQPQVELPLMTAFSDGLVTPDGRCVSALQNTLAAVESWTRALHGDHRDQQRQPHRT
jgi:NAD(P)H-dependent FMN reductase